MTSSGVKSSEFWVAVVTMLLCAFLIYTGKLSLQEAIAFAGIPSAYILSRGLAKQEPRP